MDVLINGWQGEGSFHSVCVSNHHDAHLRYFTILSINYILMKLKFIYI